MTINKPMTCDRCGEGDGTVELGSVLHWCQPCFDDAANEAAEFYSPVNMLLNTITDATIPRDEFKARLLEIVRTAVREETARCLAIVRSQPNAPGTHTGERQQWVREQIAARITEGVTVEDAVREAVAKEREACAGVLETSADAHERHAARYTDYCESLAAHVREAEKARYFAALIRARAEGGGE